MFCNRTLWNFLDLSGKSLSKFGRSLLTDLYSLKWNRPEMGKYTQRVCIALTRCDKIWQFIIFWATFQSPLQQLFGPNRQYILGNFCKGVKIYHFSREILFGQLL